MAGMPNKMIKRANEVLKQLENSHVGNSSTKKVKTAIDVDDMQLSFFQLDDPILVQIKEELIHIDINTLTPVEALMKLSEIKKSVGG
jgi:DNA mismatch repair protein MutS